MIKLLNLSNTEEIKNLLGKLDTIMGQDIWYGGAQHE